MACRMDRAHQAISSSLQVPTNQLYLTHLACFTSTLLHGKALAPVSMHSIKVGPLLPLLQPVGTCSVYLASSISSLCPCYSAHSRHQVGRLQMGRNMERGAGAGRSMETGAHAQWGCKSAELGRTGCGCV